MDYKIRVNRPCRLFIDGEEIQVLNELQLTKIDLAPGEYLRKVVAIDNPSIFDETVLSISSSKLDLITLDTTGLEVARRNALPEGEFLVGNLYYTANEDKISVSVSRYNKDFSPKELIIPDTINYAGYNYSVTSIGERAFWNCTSLTSVIIPNSVTSIGWSAFLETGIYCDDTNWENGVLYMDDCLIAAKESISGAYKIKEETRLVGCAAFCGCSSLTSVTIPNSVTSIGDYAFYGCSSLTSVIIPNSVTSIGDYAFVSCSSLTSINVDSNNPNYSSVDGVLFDKDKTTLIAYPGGKQGAYTIPNSVTSIGYRAFFNCTSLTSITILNSVTSIGDYAFYGCSSLTSVIIPNSVTSIGNGAFDGCSSLKSITIGNSVTSIGERAFWNCTSLTSVTIPNSVTSIGYMVFSGCSSFTSIKYTGTKKQWNKIELSNFWAKESGIKVIHCTDGEIRL